MNSAFRQRYLMLMMINERKNGKVRIYSFLLYSISFQNICFICFHLHLFEYQMVEYGADGSR